MWGKIWESVSTDADIDAELDGKHLLKDEGTIPVATVATLDKPADQKDTHTKTMDELDRTARRYAQHLKDFENREYRKACVQPVLFCVVVCVLVLCYFFFPIGLFAIMIFCFIFAWTFPALHIPLWVSILLLLLMGYHFITGSFTWTWLPQH
jgi:hypothetical protein